MRTTAHRSSSSLMPNTLSRIASAVIVTLVTAGSALAQTTRLPFTSTFDAGTFAEWDGFRNTTGATIPTQGCQSGRCVRIPLVPGTNSDTYGDFYFADHVGRGGPKVEEVWLRLWSKFDSGIVWPSADQKIALLNLDDSGGARRYQVILLVNDGRYQVMTSDIDNWDFYNKVQNVGTPAMVRLDQWDKLKVYVKLNTPGASNGIVRMWVNDQLKLQYTDVNVRFNSSIGINKLIFGSYATGPTPAPGVQWHDSITLSATDPDAGSTPTAPASPQNVRILP